MKFTILSILSLLSMTLAVPLDRRQCNIGGCIAALGPPAVTCTNAVVQKGKDVPVDLACITAVIDKATNQPPVCNGCGTLLATTAGKTIDVASEFILQASDKVQDVAGEGLDKAGDVIGGAADAVGDFTGDAVDGAGNIVSGVGGAIGGLF